VPLLLLKCICCIGRNSWLLLNGRFRWLWLWLLSCCWLELRLLICWLMLAVAIVQVRGPPCSVLLSPELLEML